MQRTDAVLWKKQELEAEQAAIARRAPIEQGPVSKEDPPTKANANIIYVLPKMAPEATIQLQEGINLHIHDFFESPVTAFGEHFAVPPVTGSGPTMKENHDDVVFNFNELDEQFDLTGIKTDDDLKDLASLMEDEFFEPHLSASVGDLALPPFTASDPTPELNHDEMVLSFNELDQFDPTAMFTTDDNFGGLVSPTDYFEPPTAAFPPSVEPFLLIMLTNSRMRGDFRFTASDLTPAQHHGEVLFNFNELDQHFDPNSMLTRDENFQDLFSPTEDGIQYLNANFDALWEEFE
ncbi:hypothetical protein BD410DRAFT_894018 [Rickenella mellea]|uniref:Uncharacterized protein n=1 Tax=Rickenella mellea TaxID=50990 RepID=A0A4Y7QL84_9AGAM|nr:hypothetical protein BD410DRAFT_894018 [Rickenella mellea]